jgi:hypothetical protein
MTVHRLAPRVYRRRGLGAFLARDARLTRRRWQQHGLLRRCWSWCWSWALVAAAAALLAL